MYRRSIVFDEPPAPAARAELGFATCELAALRLHVSVECFDELSFLVHLSILALTEHSHRAARLLHDQLAK